MDSVGPYAWILEMLTANLGRPRRKFVVPGEPQGFSVARKQNARMRAIAHWRGKLQSVCDHQFATRCIVATIEKPVYVHVVPYFQSRVHCDPENVRKLGVDSMYLGAGEGSGQDKYVFGSHSGPNYDIENPRTEFYIWVCDGESPPEISATAVKQANARKRREQRERDGVETIKARAKFEKIKSSNPFGFE